MKIETYLINLDGSTARLASATAQLQAVGWPFERYSAYDGRGKNIHDFENYDDRQARKLLGRSLLNSELGCYLSHYGCVEKFLQTDADYLVVLEDDLRINNHFAPVLHEFLRHLHAQKNLEWHVINLAAKKNKISKEIFRAHGCALVRAYYFPIRGLGLVWSRSGAREFVELARHPCLPVDIFFQNWLTKNGKGLSVWPPLVRPAGLDSDILGTVATQGIARKKKEDRDFSFFLKKQIRLVKNNFFACAHFLSLKS